MPTAAKKETFSASSDRCVFFPLAADGVYPKTRVWGSNEKTLHCFSATAPVNVELRWGCEKCSAETALGSALDNDGNMATKVDSTGTTQYFWDFENRMQSVTLPGSGGTVSFKYDPFGHRIYKSSSAGTSIFAYDGENLIEETSSSGTAVARYSQTQNIDEPLAVLRSGATSYYHEDALGSVTSLSNSAGALAQSYTYDSFGKQTASSGSLTNPFQHTARELDAETGLYYYRARYYDPNTGRFLNEDPTGFRGGINLYGCVGNDPINKTDPDGTGFVDCLKALADLARATANLEKDLRQIPKGTCPDAGHQKELRQRKEDLEDALKRVVTHCGKYAGAAAAIAAATRILIQVLPYLEFAGAAAAAA
jgi:RHS repeat-associated protein